MMNVAQNFKSLTVGDLDIQTPALYPLAAPSTPESAREEADERAEAGEKEGMAHQGINKTSLLGHTPCIIPETAYTTTKAELRTTLKMDLRESIFSRSCPG
jgi:hypothetical protein